MAIINCRYIPVSLPDINVNPLQWKYILQTGFIKRKNHDDREYKKRFKHNIMFQHSTTVKLVL